MVVFEALLASFRSQSEGLLRDLLQFCSCVRVVWVHLLPLVIKQVSLSNSLGRRAMEGIKASMHKLFQGERGPKLINMIWWCVEVQKT